MAEGTVKWFDSEEGHGVITPDGGGADLSVGYDEIQMSGYKTLEAGERVAFGIENAAIGPRAVNVVPLGEFAPPSPDPSRPSASAPKTPQELFIAALVWLAMPVCAVIGIILAVHGIQLAGIFFLVAIIAYFVARSGAVS